MIKVHLLTLGAYQTNCYIFHEEGSKTCCVVDPGYEPEVIEEKLRELGLTVEAILLTHGHFDHVGGVRQLAADTDCDVYLSAEDLSLPRPLTAGKLCYTHTYEEGTPLRLAGLTITVLPTPGHTPGSVCLLTEDAMFSGDTLFCGSCGRTDLPGGNPREMAASLRKLAALEENYWVLPGHGPSSTLDQEKAHNPYMN